MALRVRRGAQHRKRGRQSQRAFCCALDKLAAGDARASERPDEISRIFHGLSSRSCVFLGVVAPMFGASTLPYSSPMTEVPSRPRQCGLSLIFTFNFPHSWMNLKP
jgi:hypothetical protein